MTANFPSLGRIAVGAIIAAAASSFAQAADPAAAPADASAFARGASAWSNNCVRCHNARDPMDFRDDQWKLIMSHMRIRAGLTGALLRSTAVQRVAVGATNAGPSGKALYEGTCIACHGQDGRGTIPGVPDLADPKGRLSQADSVLKKHILDGFQSPGSPMAMPPKGGNPGLSEADVDSLLRYMRAGFKP
jgi:cytochrome c5